MAIKKKGKNLFADKASIVLRMMLQNPERRNGLFVIFLVQQELLSIGMAQEVLQPMEIKGYIEE